MQDMLYVATAAQMVDARVFGFEAHSVSATVEIGLSSESPGLGFRGIGVVLRDSWLGSSARGEYVIGVLKPPDTLPHRHPTPPSKA